ADAYPRQLRLELLELELVRLRVVRARHQPAGSAAARAARMGDQGCRAFDRRQERAHTAVAKCGEVLHRFVVEVCIRSGAHGKWQLGTSRKAGLRGPTPQARQ